jgi:hypothetical protein
VIGCPRGFELGCGMKAYKVLCLVVFEVVIPNDRHRDWLSARTILMYELVAQVLIGSTHRWRCNFPCRSLVRLPPMHA